MWIRVPHQPNTVTDVIHFQTTKERRITEVVATLNRLYQDQPVGSVRIGEECGFEHNCALKYLHAAHKDGLVKPRRKSAGGAISGWVPADAPDPVPIDQDRAERAANAVGRLYAGKVVTSRMVGALLNTTQESAKRWLKLASGQGLIQRSERPKGWLPIDVEPVNTHLDERAKEVTAVLRKLSKRGPVTGPKLAKHLGVPHITAIGWLRRARELRLVRHIGHLTGWLPA